MTTSAVQPSPHPAAGAARLLATGSHALFLVLLAIGTWRAVATGTAYLPLAVLVPVTLAVYAVGALRPVRRSGPWWLVLLTICWGGLLLVSTEFVWVAFSLWLLCVHVLGLRWALPYAVAVLAAVVAAQLTVGAHPAAVVGPAIGCVVAVGIGWGAQLLTREARERQQLVDRLVSTQAEMVELHDDLARTQREAGALTERTRLSRDIHDTLAQGFSSILLLSRAGAEQQDPARLRELLGQIEATAAENLAESRAVVRALTPAQLDVGLAASLGRLLARLEQETGLDTRLEVDGEVAVLSTTEEVALLRVAQSALANVRAHAAARTVAVTLTNAGDTVRLDVLDDGVGFDVAAWSAGRLAAGGGGYGLRAMRDRLRDLGGGLEVESVPGDGTALAAHLPLRGPQQGRTP